MIDLKTLRAIVKMMVDNDLTEVDLEDKGEKVSFKRGASGQVQYVPASMPAASAPAPGPAPAAPVASSATPGTEPAADSGLVAITSPMVGTFYSSPSPDSDHFVAVGSSIDEESVVCIIEAMKVFNEIKAEMKGTVQKVLVNNGQAVEFGQPLFLVKP